MYEILKLQEVVIFSLTLDSSTQCSFSYLTFRIHFHSKDTLHNFHIVVIPMFEQHKSEYIFDFMTTLLDSICPSWRHKLICLVFDGANVMTGNKLCDYITKLENKLLFLVHSS